MSPSTAMRRAPAVSTELRERHERGFHRRGIGVVRVVEHGHARGGLEQFHSPAAGSRGRERRPRSRRAAGRTRAGRPRSPSPRSTPGGARAAARGTVGPRRGTTTGARRRPSHPRSDSRRRADSPTVTTSATVMSASSAVAASSAFSTASPVPGSASSSSASTAITPSRPPRYSAWASPTLVTMPVSGRAISQSRCRSPANRSPISVTTTLRGVGCVAERDRQTELVVVRLCVRVAALRREHGCKQVLGRRLSGRARRPRRRAARAGRGATSARSPAGRRACRRRARAPAPGRVEARA